jgi:hypothetical protein
MRSHQLILRTFSQAHLQKTEDHLKQSFSATFTSSTETHSIIQDLWNEFISKVQKKTSHLKAEHLFQVHFDFFRWL